MPKVIQGEVLEFALLCKKNKLKHGQTGPNLPCPCECQNMSYSSSCGCVKRRMIATFNNSLLKNCKNYDLQKKVLN